MTGIRVPLIASVGVHAAALLLLIVFVRAVPPPYKLPAQKSFEVVMMQSAPAPAAVEPPEPTPQPKPPPEPPAPAEAATPAPEKPIPPPPPKPTPPPEPAPVPPPEAPPAEKAVAPPPPPKRVEKHVRQRHTERKREPRHRVPEPAWTPPPVAAPPRYVPPLRAYVPPARAYAPPPRRVAPAPAPEPSPELLAGYRAALSAWFERHKRYPASARERGEEGSAVVRFRVDRWGRVLDYAITRSTGYPDLDAGITDMLSGAQLPPFPAGMTQAQFSISVTLRFSLAR
jgi:protein TonB